MARNSMGGYISYNFQNHDPVIDQIDRLYERVGVDVKQRGAMAHVAAKSGLSITTLYNWRKRKTKRPQWASVNAVVRGLGGRIVLTVGGKTIRPPSSING